MKNFVTYANNKSSTQKNMLAITTNTSTTIVVVKVSWRLGQNTLRNSTRDSSTNCQKLRPYCENANTTMPSSKAADHRHPARPRFGTALEDVVRHNAADHQNDGGDQFGGVGACRHRRLLFNFVVHVPQMAGQEGIEPPTCGFGDRRSAN